MRFFADNVADSKFDASWFTIEKQWHLHVQTNVTIKRVKTTI